MPSIQSIVILCAALFVAACDSGGGGKVVPTGEPPKGSSALERPGLMRAPGKGLPPELRPPR
jgi:hypothetical protein